MYQDLARYLRGNAVTLPANRNQFMIQLDCSEPLGARQAMKSDAAPGAFNEAQKTRMDPWYMRMRCKTEGRSEALPMAGGCAGACLSIEEVPKIRS